MELFKPPKNLIVDENIANNWKKFKQSYEIYMTASGNNSKTPEVKAAILLNFLGEEGLDLFNTFNLNEEDEKKPEIIIKAFDDYVNPRRNVIFERFIFHQRIQKENEDFAVFLRDIKTLVKTCEFKEQEDEMLRDKIVLGVNSRELQERLLRMADLKLNDAIKTCQAAEISKKQVKSLHVENHIDELKDDRNEKLKYHCKKCNYKHGPRECPAYGKYCKNCKKANHFAVGCRSTKNQMYNNKNVQEINVEEEDSIEDITELFQVHSLNDTVNTVCTHSREDIWTQDVEINNHKINFKLDTGAQVNVLPFKTFKKIVGKDQLLRESRGLLEAFGGEKIKPLGNIKLSCKINNSIGDVEFAVVNKNVMPILGLQVCKKFNLLVKITNSKIDTLKINSKNEFIKNNNEIFEGLGAFPEYYTIKTKVNAEGVIRPPRRLPQVLLNKFEKELNKMIENGIVSKVSEPKKWSSNVVLVEKPDGSLRICLDPNELNKVIVRDYCLIPRFEDIRPKLLNKKFYTLLDLKQGFWQIKLDKESSDLCTFSTPFGFYKFNRLPFGLSCAPEAFINMVQKYFGKIDVNNIVIYFDDLLIATENEELHDMLLKKVVSLAKKINIKFNLRKLQYKQANIEFLGHKFNKNGVIPSEEHTKSILNLKEPKNKKELQSLLGMFNYLRQYIPNMSTICSPLRELLKKDSAWFWSSKHRESLNKLKEIVAKPPVLNQFDVNKHIEIYSDASKDGLGCCLIQNKRPVSFASRSMSNTETAYSQIEKEMLSLIFACRKFHYLIYGRKVVAFNDHKPLISIMNKDISLIPSQRLQ